MVRLCTLILPLFLFTSPMLLATSDEIFRTDGDDRGDDGEEVVDIDLAAVEERATQRENDRNNWRSCSFFRTRTRDLTQVESAVVTGVVRGAAAYATERAINTTVAHHHVITPVSHAIGVLVSAIHCTIL